MAISNRRAAHRARTWRTGCAAPARRGAQGGGTAGRAGVRGLLRPWGMRLVLTRMRRLALVAGALVALVTGLFVAPYLKSGEVPRPTLEEARMPGSSTLVIYYSRTGTTAKLAEAIASATGADLERLTDNVPRAGVLGFVRSLGDAIRRSETPLNPLRVRPAEYALVIVGTPDWGQSVAAPVRTFLKAHQGKLTQVAFFLTDGETDHAKVFAEMEALSGRKPVATLGLPHDQVVKGDYQGPVRDFVRSLPLAIPAAEPQPQQPATAQF